MLRGFVCGNVDDLGYISLTQNQAGQIDGIGPDSRLATLVADGLSVEQIKEIWAGFAALDAATQGEELQTDTLFQGPQTRYRNVAMPHGFADEEDFVASWPSI